MTTNMFPLYWKNNPKWFSVNEIGEFVLTGDAPEEARKSFAEWNDDDPYDKEGSDI